MQINKLDTDPPWIMRDVKRVFWIGVVLGIPVGWAVSPFIFAAFGATITITFQ